VLNSQGQLALPDGHPAAEEQYQRLVAEGIIVTNRRVDMKRYGWPD
jgi:methylated-DNA-protein-cysteine methyltransferase-like protein